MSLEIKPVEIVTINQKLKIHKNGEAATNIEVVRFKFDSTGESCAFNAIARIGLYELGSKAIFIQPDYCVPNTPLFSDFIAPDGDVKRTRLGANNRIRSSKFSFSFEHETQPIWSFGILSPFNIVESYLAELNFNITDCDLTKTLDVVKYEEIEPSTQGNGLVQGEFPFWMYKTDEPMYQNLVTHIQRVLEDGSVLLSLSLKIDGSSLTVAFKKIDGELKTFVCSRSMWKKLEQRYVSNYKNEAGQLYRKHFQEGVKGWLCEETNDFRTNDSLTDLIPVEVEVYDSWVELAKSSGLLERGRQYCIDNDLELAFRAEIYGKGLKGSGNKLNPHSKQEQNLMLFGLDNVSGTSAIRLNMTDEFNLQRVANDLNLPVSPTVIIAPYGYNDLCNIIQSMFAEYKKQGMVIEGIVVRTIESNDLSCKFINPEYDNKK